MTREERTKLIRYYNDLFYSKYQDSVPYISQGDIDKAMKIAYNNISDNYYHIPKGREYKTNLGIVTTDYDNEYDKQLHNLEI